MQGTSLKQLIQSLMPPQPDVIIGKVTSASPLVIQGKFDESLIIRDAIIGEMFRESPLQAGDEVHILVYNNRKSYFVLDRR